jgi:hypothetical protein
LESSGDIINGSQGSRSSYTISPANANGISFNRFSEFSVDGAGLDLLNISNDNPADIIIIEAPNITLASEVRLVGARSDILFISNESGPSIVCSNCSFDGFMRVTLASAKLADDYSEEKSEIGDLDSSIGGSVIINHLDAHSILMLDVIAKDVSMEGLVDLTQRVKRSPLGGLISDKNGNLSLGAGILNINIGSLKWNYDDQVLSQSMGHIVPTPGEAVLNGNIKSAEIKILSTKNLVINAGITNTVDILSSSSYKGGIVIPNGNTTITTLENTERQSISPYYTAFITPTTNISLNSSIQSNGSLVVNSAGGLYVTGDNLKAEKIDLNAIGTMKNLNSITADNVSIAAKTIINRGKIKAKQLVTLWGQRFVANEFGGSIGAEEVVLASNSLVRNGSRTPYISDHPSIRQRLADHSAVLNPSSINNGMYYATDHHLITNKIKPDSSKASIYGERVSIKSAAFENINPYWVDLNYINDLDLSPTASIRRDLVNSVSVSAESTLAIRAHEYIYNSSAILNVYSEDGLMSIKGSFLNNDRYRQVNLLNRSYEEERIILNNNLFAGGKKYTDTPRKIETLTTRSYVYSPPGRIYTAGEFYAGPVTEGGPSSVVNNLGFIEIGRDAKITSSSIKQKGLEHHGIKRVREPEIAPVPGSGAIDVGNCIGCRLMNEETGNIMEELVTIDSRELDAFFAIGGQLFASRSAFSADNSSAFMEYIEKAINHRISSGNTNFDFTVPDARSQTRCGMFGCANSTTTTTREAAPVNADAVFSGIESGIIQDIDVELVETMTERSDWTGGVMSEEKRVVSQESWSLFDTLNDYYEAIKQHIIDMIQRLKDQFDWWE